MNNLESNIWGKKKFSDLLKEIYDNQKKKEAQISALIGELKPLINDIGDATLIVPLIKEYMELGIKNDEQLIKMVNIAQRALSSGKSEEESFGMTDDEKAQLLSEVKKFGGQQTLSVELLDRSSPVFFDELVRQMEFAYAKATDSYVMGEVANTGTLNATAADEDSNEDTPI